MTSRVPPPQTEETRNVPPIDSTLARIARGIACSSVVIALGCGAPAPHDPRTTAAISNTAVARAAATDRDGDEILDDVDRCAGEPEDFDANQDDDGCPEPDDDGDGVLDEDDNCPSDKGVAGGGCPENCVLVTDSVDYSRVIEDLRRKMERLDSVFPPNPNKVSGNPDN